MIPTPKPEPPPAERDDQQPDPEGFADPRAIEPLPPQRPEAWGLGYAPW